MRYTLASPILGRASLTSSYTSCAVGCRSLPRNTSSTARAFVFNRPSMLAHPILGHPNNDNRSHFCYKQCTIWQRGLSRLYQALLADTKTVMELVPFTA